VQVARQVDARIEQKTLHAGKTAFYGVCLIHTATGLMSNPCILSIAAKIWKRQMGKLLY
jgi:hypothetical protein